MDKALIESNFNYKFKVHKTHFFSSRIEGEHVKIDMKGILISNDNCVEMLELRGNLGVYRQNMRIFTKCNIVCL